MIFSLLTLTATAVKINRSPVGPPKVEDFSYENELDYLLMTQEAEVCGNEFLVDEFTLLQLEADIAIPE